MIKNVEESFRRRYAWDQSQVVGICISDFRALHHSQKSSTLPFSVPTPHVASALNKCCHIHGSRASLLRRNMTSVACARTFTRAHARSTLSVRCGPCHTFRKVMARTITKGPAGVPAMEMITGAEACRRHGARRRNHTPKDSSRTYHLHRQMIDDHALRGGLAGL